jgi:peptidyl-prolyl cis-trans isomerase C
MQPLQMRIEKELARRASDNEGLQALVFVFHQRASAWISCFLLSLACLLTGCFSQKSLILNKTVLKVNKTEISTQQFSERLATRLRGYDALHAKDEANLTRAKEETLQAFILEVIGKDYAAKSGLTISRQEVDAKVAEIRSRYPDDLAFRRAMAEENLSLEKWKEALEFTLLQKKIFEKITKDLPPPTENEIKNFYDASKSQFNHPARVRLRQIVLEKEDDAKRILDDLNDGGNMAKLAKQFSVAPEGTNGGDTGWIEKGTLEVFEPAFKMAVGTRTKVIKSPYGYHIYEVLKKEPEGRLSFVDAKAKIRAQLVERSDRKAFSAWLEEQVRHSSVQRNDALIQAIKVTTRGS